MKQGMGLLEVLLYRQPVQQNQLLLKVIHSFFSVSFLSLLQLCLFSLDHLGWMSKSVILRHLSCVHVELGDLPSL